MRRPMFCEMPLAMALVVSLLAGCGTAGDGMEGPLLLRGDLYIATLFDGSVFRYDSKTNQLKTVVSNLGTGGVGGIAVNREDCNLYVSLLGLPGAGVNVYSGTTDALLLTLVPPDLTRNGGLLSPGPMTFGPDGTLYVTSGTRLVQYAKGTGQVIRAFPLPTGASYITFGQDGILYLSLPAALAVGGLNLRTGEIKRFVDFPLGMPWGITFGPGGDFFAVQNIDHGRATLASVLRFTSTGQSKGVFIHEGSGGLGDASDLAVGPDRNLYVLGFSGNKLLGYRGTDGSPLGALLTTPGLGAPLHVAFSPCSR